jgi:hypothetical protein
VYVTPPDRPETLIGELPPVAVIPPELAVTVYPVMVDPPLSAGAVNAMEAVEAPVTVAITDVGAPGTVLAAGHKPAATACICWVWFHMLDAVPDLPPVVVGAVLLIKPPRYLVDIS